MLILFGTCCSVQLHAQNIKTIFNIAYKKFAAEKVFRHATIGLLVINNSTGQTITSVNAETGLAPASCQKVITASTAFELLRHDYTYATTLGYTGKVANGVLNGDIIIKGNGDPTLGSWRYTETTEENIISEFKKGEIIKLVDENNKPIGLGIAEYGSDKAAEMMGQKNQKALVHYDYLYLES